MTSNELNINDNLLESLSNTNLVENVVEHDVKNEIISDVEETSSLSKSKGRRKARKKSKKVQGHNFAAFKVEAEYSDDDNGPDATVFMLKSLVEEICDSSILWEAVKCKILPHLKIWDILIQKVTLSNQESFSPGNANSNEIFASKFQTVLHEVESILKGLQVMMDSCLIPNEQQQQADALEIRPSSEICRALCMPVDSSFRVNAEKQLDIFDGKPDEKFTAKLEHESTYPQRNRENLPFVVVNEFEEAETSDETGSSKRIVRKPKSETRFIAKKRLGTRRDIEASERPNSRPFKKNPDDKRYYCTFPGCVTGPIKNWTCSSGVWKHFLSEHADVAGKMFCMFSCQNCDRRFPTKALLNQHQKEKHVNHFEFVCNVCAKRLPTNVALMLHLRMHSGEKPFSCDLCNYRSIRQAAVNQHKIRMHESEIEPRLRKHVCDKCGKTFKERCKLREHIKTHEDVRTFLCGFCGKGLKNKQSLNRHMFTHGMKNECGDCGKFFSTPSTLAIHQRDKHGMSI